MNTSDLKQEFTEAFDTKPERVFFSPGRINLIGEHTDYNGGHVSHVRLQSGHMVFMHPGQIRQCGCTQLIFQMLGSSRLMSTTFHMTKPLVGQIILRE